ncbi:MAG: sigma-54 dependent transcriptional regulator, partial [Cyclobacteriaceae bacterium]
GALPDNLAGSELFGHTKGAFTGATANKKGSFEMADKGTLFLDEVGNLSYENQMKMLRVLQERVVKRIGSTKDIKVDVRVIAATNENLKDAVDKGDFREDLYHRINEFHIHLPPLRERKEDIEYFMNLFREQANHQLNKHTEGFDPSTRRKLINYEWHGNLRELKNVIKRAVLLARQNQITLSCLPEEISGIAMHEQPSETSDKTDLKSIAEQAERNAILEVLKQTDHNKTRAAEILNIDRKTLYNKMKSYNIDLDTEDIS